MAAGFWGAGGGVGGGGQKKKSNLPFAFLDILIHVPGDQRAISHHTLGKIYLYYSCNDIEEIS